MSTWYSKHVEESNNIWRINNIQCITLVVLYGQFMMHGQRNIYLSLGVQVWKCDWSWSIRRVRRDEDGAWWIYVYFERLLYTVNMIHPAWIFSACEVMIFTAIDDEKWAAIVDTEVQQGSSNYTAVMQLCFNQRLNSDHLSNWCLYSRPENKLIWSDNINQQNTPLLK